MRKKYDDDDGKIDSRPRAEALLYGTLGSQLFLAAAHARATSEPDPFDHCAGRPFRTVDRTWRRGSARPLCGTRAQVGALVPGVPETFRRLPRRGRSPIRSHLFLPGGTIRSISGGPAGRTWPRWVG